MSNSSWNQCGVELEESYGVVLNLALIERHGQHEILTDEDPSQLMCEKCWEHIGETITQLFKNL